MYLAAYSRLAYAPAGSSRGGGYGGYVPGWCPGVLAYAAAARVQSPTLGTLGFTFGAGAAARRGPGAPSAGGGGACVGFITAFCAAAVHAATALAPTRR